MTRSRDPDGPAPDPVHLPSPGSLPPLRLSPASAEVIRTEIRRAGGREVTFLLNVAEGRLLVGARAVARGNRSAVLAAARDAPQGGVMIHNHPSGDLEPSSADLNVAAALYENGIGSAIVSNDASRIYVVVEPPPERVVERLDLGLISSLLGPGGGLALAHRAFEDRPGQRDMALLVAGRYNDGGLGLVEAGTGTGKSMAYLLPAAIWALRNGERTVISTNTINLQEQLQTKDLPLLERVLGEELRWALVKGRGNYVSIRRAHLALAAAPTLFDEDRTPELQAITSWLETTLDGSLSDLSSPPSDEVWEEVRSDPDICLRARCPHFQACFYQKARREAASAQILVVNHHLLFTDLAIRRATGNFTQAAVLPPFRHLILDEAHNVEDAATDHLGVEVSRHGLFRLLSRLESRGKGVLIDLKAQFQGDPDAGSAAEHLSRIAERVLPAVQEARAALEPFLDGIGGVLAERDGSWLRLGGAAGLEPGSVPRVKEPMEGLIFAFRVLAREIGELRARIQDDEAWAEALEGRSLDLSSAQYRLEAHAQGIRRVLDPGEEKDSLVRWLEARGRAGSGNLAMAAAPIEIGPLVRQDLFQRLDTVILTSATLTTKTGFEYLRTRLGLQSQVLEEEDLGPEVVEASLPSPFDFETQTLLAVPTDLSGPSAQGDRFQEQTAGIVEDTAGITGGGLFVLFTSHRALRRVAEILRQRPASLPGPLFVQGEAPRARILQQFERDGHGILLGTSSFWEGVDVPGDPLRGLILQKLPFQVPTEPIIAARMEAIEARGEDPFWTYSLPAAALRLKQGFGRLIRTREDRGAVLVLDHRLTTRKYGPYLRQSLPPAPLSKGPWHELRARLGAFYG